MWIHGIYYRSAKFCIQGKCKNGSIRNKRRYKSTIMNFKCLIKFVTHYLAYGLLYRPNFKQKKSCKCGLNHNITKGASAYSGSPYMMSRDQLYCVMTSSNSHGDTLILSRAYISKRQTIIYSFMINRFFGI